MLKKTITYENFNEETVSEDFFFHLSKAELVELEMSHDGGLSAALARIVAAEDTKSIISEFKNIILGSYGQKSIDGKRFVKNQTLRDEFESSEAYSTLFMELIENADAAAEFINGIIPKGMAEEAAKITALAPVPAPEPESESPPVPVPVPASEPKVLSKKDLIEMSPEDIQTLGARLTSGEVTLGDDVTG